MDTPADAAGDIGAGAGPGKVAAGDGLAAAGDTSAAAALFTLMDLVGFFLKALLLLELGDLLGDQIFGFLLRLQQFFQFLGVGIYVGLDLLDQLRGFGDLGFDLALFIVEFSLLDLETGTSPSPLITQR